MGSLSREAGAQPLVWSVLPVASQGVDSGVAATFRDLLEAELRGEVRAQFVSAPSPCADVECARAAGAYIGAHYVVFGTLRPLGSKLLAQVTLVEASTGRVLGVDTMSAERLEELDEVARRLARGLVSRREPYAGAIVGGVDASEPPAAVRRGRRSGLMARFGGLVPLSDRAYGGLGTGMALDLGAWIQGDSFALEPRAGLRFDVRGSDAGSYFSFPLDLGAFFLTTPGEVTPFVGGGIGMRYLHETRRQDIQLGSAVLTEHRGEFDDSAWGVGAFARGGLLFFRSDPTHLILTGDYDVTFVQLNEGRYAQSFVFGLGIVL
ncbi:MAG: hypothetical protein MUF54_20040 [Polyangiaceae bacterium]|jgi:hypothetical protein|nr:hypothetical protein [Polyangiaceae bacterium]